MESNTDNTVFWDAICLGFKETLTALYQGSLPSVSELAAEHADPFRVLISTIISLRTKDEVTLQASRTLFSLAATPEAMLKLPEEAIAKAIYPAGFYKTKAGSIHRISEILLNTYEGRVPSSKEALLDLPGVGVKTANLTLNLGFGIDAICVDTHVHRISNRCGWVSTKTPEETEKALELIMPRKYWIPLNELLVSYGQKVCTPQSPHCSLCHIQENCPKISVKKSR